MKVFVFLLAMSAAALALPTVLNQNTNAQQAYPIIPYNFGYEVADAATNNFQNRAEIKTASGDVFGSWSWLMPTNEIFTLSYNVTGNQGFQYSTNITPVGAGAQA